MSGGCCSYSSSQDAKRVCDKLKIPHYTLNFTEEFKKYVIDDFIKCYQECKTPNPCIECNKYIKFDLLYKKAQELECDYIATGHYAKVEYSDKYKQYVLRKSQEERKDQTYFLYSIDKKILPNILFPLENYTDKKQVRNIATENELQVAKKPDSQEVCFIPDNDYASFVEKNITKKIKKGDIVLSSGKVIGKHDGLIHYTVGQRKGLGISYQEPLYVLELDQEKNRLIVGTEKELYKNKLLNFLVDFENWGKRVFAKIRYRASLAEVEVEKQENTLEVIFSEPQRAITRGQSVVFYDQDGIVLGGGKIM